MPRHFAAARTLGAPAGTASMLLATVFALAACSADVAPSAPITPPAAADSGAAQSTPIDGARWSNAATWPDGKVPGPGADVVIPEGKRVVLDGTTAPIRTLMIMGELTAAGSDVRLTAAKIDVMGKFTVGSAAAPFTGHLVVTLTEGSPAGDQFNKGIMVHPGADLELFGEHRTTWTRLGATAEVGATSITLEKPTDWRAGDRIVLASTGDSSTHTDTATIRSVSGAVATLSRPLRYQHWGQIQTIEGATVDERGEVALLTHNVVVQGDSASETSGHGGHIMIMRGGVAHVDGVELYRMGQHATLARYPFHWHMAGSVAGQFFTNSSVWHTFNRCVTIHGTHDALVADNVCYDHEGHGYFLEDGIEHGNTLRGNLGLTSRPGAVLPSDRLPATFWITNPDNTVEGNVAAGSSFDGFWLSPPKHPTGYSATDAIWPINTPLRRFADNVTHSNANDGVSVQEAGDTFGWAFIDYRPRSDATPTGTPVEAVITGLQSYHNRRGFWSRGDHIHVRQSVFADDRYAVQIGDASVQSYSGVESSTIVGVSANPSTTFTSGVLGMLIYDGPVTIDGVTFANFPADRGAAIGPEPGFDGENAVSNGAMRLRFVDARRFFVNPNTTATGERATVYRDLDGSISGTPNASIVASNPLFSSPTCVPHADWGAMVCPVSYVHLRFADGHGLAPGLVRSDDGTAVSFNGDEPELIQFNAPVGYTYSLEQTGLTGGLALDAMGLPPGETVTMSVPWPDTAVYALLYDQQAVVPIVKDRQSLESSNATSVWIDMAAKRLYVRFVGLPTGEQQRVGAAVVR